MCWRYISDLLASSRSYVLRQKLLHLTMATQVETNYTQKKAGSRHRNRNRGRKANPTATEDPAPCNDVNPLNTEENAAVTPTEGTEQQTDEADVCFICAEQVKYYSVSECNHRTCHVCALRLRALYKKKECTFCNLEVW